MGARPPPDVAKHEGQWAAGVAGKFVHSLSISPFGPVPLPHCGYRRGYRRPINLKRLWFSRGRILAAAHAAGLACHAMGSTLQRPKSSWIEKKNVGCQSENSAAFLLLLSFRC